MGVVLGKFVQSSESTYRDFFATYEDTGWLDAPETQLPQGPSRTLSYDGRLEVADYVRWTP